MEKKSHSFSPLTLTLAGSLLMTGGWMMAPFPVFIFFGLAPLFALTDRAEAGSVWEKMEWVFMTLTVAFLASYKFDFNYLVKSLALAILFTLPFIGYLWVKKTLGIRAGKITIVFFWLSLEYLALKISPERSVFLADALQLQPDWTRWNFETGYLGSSFLILITNYMVYLATLSAQPFRWYWIVTALLLILAPMVSSYFLNFTSITRQDMMNLYSENASGNLMYLARGEFVVRTSMWISTLILLFTLVKSQTTRG